ncbi:hypothetical protein CK625_10520 [Vandammella animalimorsus]|uniref:UPF0391 membrane protein CK625_10520 n=1 Tax=Vandammella animalimorsus TaxID=2029117 RepID=A0A2A2AFL9_9BURK|nr:hypothetical protein CK625_10520 [Vandammella animalimorsus]
MPRHNWAYVLALQWLASHFYIPVTFQRPYAEACREFDRTTNLDALKDSPITPFLKNIFLPQIFHCLYNVFSFLAEKRKDIPCFANAVIFFVIALVAALFGFTGIAAGASEIAKILFFVFIIFAVVTFVLNAIRK